MAVFTLQRVSYSNFGYGTWTSRFTFRFDLSDFDPNHDYDLKFFYHIPGGTDPYGRMAGMNAWSWEDSFTLQLAPRQSYVFTFELWDITDNYNTGWQLSGYSITVPAPPIQLWSWNNDVGSYNYVNKYDNRQDLFSSRDAAYTGHRTIDFKRQTWNDIIDWLIYVYKQATNSTDSTYINDQWFYPSGTSGRAYLTSTQSHPDPIIFRANNWNLMSYIGNWAAIALDGSSFISQVSTGDRVESHIFSDVIDEINRLIRIYNANLQS